MTWWTLSNLRTIQETETDQKSPVSEELMGQIRENLECLFRLLFDTGVSGTASANGSGAVFTDSTKTWTADEHINRTLLITSGDDVGAMYTIDDNDATTLTCTGDDLSNISSGDGYLILHDVKGANGSVHTHDGVDTPLIDTANNSIRTVVLESTTQTTSTGSSEQTVTGSTVNLADDEFVSGITYYWQIFGTQKNSTKSIRLYVGTATLSITLTPTAANTEEWSAEFWVRSEGLNNQKVVGKLLDQTTGITQVLIFDDTTDFGSGAQTMYVTIESNGAAGDDITAEYCRVEKWKV